MTQAILTTWGTTDTRRKSNLSDDFEYGRYKNDYLLTRAQTFFICMIRAKVKSIWIAARTEAKRGLLSTRTLYSYKLSYFIKQVIIFYLGSNSETQYSSYPQSG